jgi:hypothetical protein
MAKVKKNGKLSKPKAKAKPKAERQDNTKSSSTKSKSVNQSQNVNVSVSIVKNKAGGSSKSAEGNQSNNNQVIKPKPQTQPQNVYYQQPNNNNSSYNSELTTLLKDMNKQLYAQRDIKALNQSPINPTPNPIINKPLFEVPKLPAYVGGNNVFEDEPFEGHYSDITSLTTDSNITSAKIVSDNSTVTEVSEVPIAREMPSSPAQRLLIPTTSPTNSLSNYPNPFEGRKLSNSEIPVETKGGEVLEEEIVVTARKKKPPIQTTLPFTSPKQVPVIYGEDTPSTSNFAEREIPVRQVSAPNYITSVFTSKKQFRNTDREEKVNEIKRLEEEYGIDLKYSPDMKAGEVYNILVPYVKDGRSKKEPQLKRA